MLRFNQALFITIKLNSRSVIKPNSRSINLNARSIKPKSRSFKLISRSIKPN